MQDAPRTPPRFVPTLTEVVDVPPDGVGRSSPVEVPSANSSFSPQMQQALVERVLKRVDQTLGLRLREAVAAAAAEQAETVARRMRVEIETVVGELVAQAVAAELAARIERAPSRD